MHNDKRVDESIAVVVVKSVVHLWVSGYSCVSCHNVRSRLTRGSADPEVIVRVPRKRLRQRERTGNFADNIDQIARDLAVVLFDTAMRQQSGREEQITEMRCALAHCTVRELHKHNDHSYCSPQWCAVSRRSTDCVRPGKFLFRITRTSGFVRLRGRISAHAPEKNRV